jgi:hypothetical protein
MLKRIMLIGMLSVFGVTSAFAMGAKTNFIESNGIFQGTNTSNFVMGDYDFTLYNKSKGWVINGFYTLQNGKWSKNWLTGTVASGASIKMVWSSEDGDCVVPFKVNWVDYGMSEQFNVDWCKKPKNVYMLDEGFKVD